MAAAEHKRTGETAAKEDEEDFSEERPVSVIERQPPGLMEGLLLVFLLILTAVCFWFYAADLLTRYGG
jgi:hypothetical protein